MQRHTMVWESRLMTMVITVSAILFVVLPIVWVIDASFQTRIQLFSKPPTWIPTSLHLENYSGVLKDPVVLRSLLNSGLVSITTTLIALCLGSLAAYSFVRLKIPAKSAIFTSILATQMLPSVAVLIPIYMLLRRWGLVYTYQGLIIAYTTFTLPYVIWLLRAFFTSIPAEIEEQGMIDGCSRLGAIIRIVLPLSMNGFLSVGIFAFIGAWNEFMMASILTNNITKTYPVRVAQFIGEETTAYEHMFAAAVIGILPVLLLVTIFQRRIVAGLTEGGIK